MIESTNITDHATCENITVVFPSHWKQLLCELNRRRLKTDLLRIMKGGVVLRIFDEDRDFIIAVYRFDSEDLCRLGMLSPIIEFQCAHEPYMEKDKMNHAVVFEHQSKDGRHSFLYVNYRNCFALSYESDTFSLPFVEETINACKEIINQESGFLNGNTEA